MSNKPKLAWTSHPLVDNPLGSVLLIIFLIGFAYGFWQLAVVTWEMPLFYILGILFLLISLTPYFIPTTYMFYEYKIEVYYSFIKIERRYEEFGCYYADKKGVMLSTFKKPRRLDSFRGLSLRFSKDKK